MTALLNESGARGGPAGNDAWPSGEGSATLSQMWTW